MQEMLNIITFQGDSWLKGSLIDQYNQFILVQLQCNARFDGIGMIMGA